MDCVCLPAQRWNLALRNNSASGYLATLAVVRAVGLQVVGSWSSPSDPCCIVTGPGRKGETIRVSTRVCKHTVNPVWEERFRFETDTADAYI